ncbi:hypothetical protein ZWY2020_009720 [Hordeum vulgare]|nr:hypothetical protein ZWY2020_009720 [Hordeum vulgare]
MPVCHQMRPESVFSGQSNRRQMDRGEECQAKLSWILPSVRSKKRRQNLLLVPLSIPWAQEEAADLCSTGQDGGGGATPGGAAEKREPPAAPHHSIRKPRRLGDGGGGYGSYGVGVARCAGRRQGSEAKKRYGREGRPPALPYLTTGRRRRPAWVG